MSFGNPAALLFLSLIPAVILLYFLRLRRRDLLVSSTLLWSRALEDRRVNSPFQRFRRSLLLLLQILAILALVAAFSKPQRVIDVQIGRTHVLLIDVSASMAVEENGRTRLERAKENAREYLGRVGANERAVLIRFARRAQAVTPVTDDLSIIEKAIRALEVRPTRTNIGEAIELAGSIVTAGAAGVQSSPHQEVDALAVVFSDGAFEAWNGEEIPFPVEYVKVGTSRRNSGVVALSSRMDLSGTGRPQIFVEVKNFADEPVSGMVTIQQGGVDIRADVAEQIAAGGHWTRSFDAGLEEGIIEVIWDPEGGDDLRLDNRAWLQMQERHDVLVWHVGSSNYFLEDALASMIGMVIEKVSPEGVALRLTEAPVPPDVILWDGVTPAKLPERVNHLFVGAIPPDVWDPPPEEMEHPPVVSWDRRHPVNRFISYSALDQGIAKAWILSPLPTTHVLLDSRGGGLISTFTTASCRGIVVAFDLLDTRWPLELSFPLFLYNALTFLGQSETGIDAGVQGEELLTLTAAPGVEEFRVTRPGGETVTVRAEAGGRLSYTETDRLGPYSVSWKLSGVEEEQTRVVPVNLLSPRESEIAPRDTLEIAGEKIGDTASTNAETRRDYWPWLLLLALGLLLGEWYCYHRR